MSKAAVVRLSQTLYRRKLLEKRCEFQGAMNSKLSTLSCSTREAEEDQATTSHEEFILLRVNGLDYAQLRLVDEALARLEHGSFGECLRCGEPIPAKRLKAIPWARFCIACQEAQNPRG